MTSMIRTRLIKQWTAANDNLYKAASLEDLAEAGVEYLLATAAISAQQEENFLNATSTAKQWAQLSYGLNKMDEAIGDFRYAIKTLTEKLEPGRRTPLTNPKIEVVQHALLMLYEVQLRRCVQHKKKHKQSPHFYFSIPWGLNRQLDPAEVW